MTPVKARREKGKLQQAVSIGRHHLVADVSPEKGGEDAGPSPRELLAASLATCIAITVEMYARRKGWPLQNAEVSVSEGHDGGATRFLVTLGLIGPLDETQRKRILEIANHCPVHKALVGKIIVETRS